MKFNPSRPAIWIADQSALDKALPSLMGARTVGVDTESNSLYAYQEQVCLIQFSTSKDDYLIDALADIDLSALAPLFADQKIEKIFHAAEYDVICLRRDFGFEFNNLFDTMQAARILGFKKLGLSNMLEDQFRVSPVKSFQKANWGKRPLKPEMLHYARVDTHFLIPLRARLHKQLENAGLLDLAYEDFSRLAESANHVNHGPLYAHVRGYYKLTPRKLAILNELCIFRDKMAARLNRPHFKVLGSNALYAIVDAEPGSMGVLKQVDGLSPRLADRYGEGLLKAVAAGKKAPPITLKKTKRPPQVYLKRVEKLKRWRKERARKMGVESDVVLPRETLEAIAGSGAGTLKQLKDVMADVPWRFDQFGSEILSLIGTGNRK